MKFHVRERGRDQGRYDHSRPLGPTTHSFLRRRIVKSANQAGFLPRGLTPSVDGRPSVSRRWATEAVPKSGRANNASSDISRTCPTVFRPAATEGSPPPSRNRTQVNKQPPRLKLLDQTTRGGNSGHRGGAYEAEYRSRSLITEAIGRSNGRGASVPRFLVGAIGLDRMREKNAGASQSHGGHY